MVASRIRGHDETKGTVLADHRGERKPKRLIAAAPRGLYLARFLHLSGPHRRLARRSGGEP